MKGCDLLVLTPEQQALLDGSKGKVMAKIVKTLVMYGETFGAERMVPVTSKYGHTVISYGLKVLGPVLDVFDEIIDAGLIVPDSRDVEECVSDTWLRVWNSIPPDRPDSLKAYVARSRP